LKKSPQSSISGAVAANTEIAESVDWMTPSYAVHCPGVATKVLAIVFDSRWLSPTRTHKPERYHLFDSVVGKTKS